MTITEGGRGLCSAGILGSHGPGCGTATEAVSGSVVNKAGAAHWTWPPGKISEGSLSHRTGTVVFE